MTASIIVKLLRAKFCPPVYAFLEGVANGTGGVKLRTADAVAMSVWPSRGLELHGLEVKVSRSDWKRELENPAKAEAVCKFMDRWWVAAPEGVVSKDELPPTWGLLEIGEKLKTTVSAPKLSPVPVTRAFLAELLRKSCEQSAEKAALAEQYEAGLKAGLERYDHLLKSGKEERQQLEKAIQEFESASGLRINAWQGGTRLGEVVRTVLRGQTPGEVLERIAEETVRLQGAVANMLALLRGEEKVNA